LKDVQESIDDEGSTGHKPGMRAMANSLFKRIAKVWSAAAGAARGTGAAASSPPRVDLAVFGKHPGWDDHIPDDVGLDTARLVEAKQRLYLQGIGGNIDSGTWDKLPATQQIAFGHTFAWRPAPADGAAAGDRELLVGRLWHSSDGKRRERYPMIACASTTNASAEFVVADVLPALAALAAECAAASTEEGVRSAVGHTRDALRSRLASPAPAWPGVSAPASWPDSASAPVVAPPEVESALRPGGPEMDNAAWPGDALESPVSDDLSRPVTAGIAEPAPTALPRSMAPFAIDPLAYLSARPEMGPAHQGLLRILYLVRQEMASFRADAAHASKGFGGLRPQQARVPACDDDPARAALRWLEFLASRVDPRAPILVFVPQTADPSQAWADLIVGDAGSTQLYCLRASQVALPLSTEIPYNLPPDFVADAERQIATRLGA
jgi:hypothetical protein